MTKVNKKKTFTPNIFLNIFLYLGDPSCLLKIFWSLHGYLYTTAKVVTKKALVKRRLKDIPLKTHKMHLYM